jgi:Flp pilus assembly protein TadB
VVVLALVVLAVLSVVLVFAVVLVLTVVLVFAVVLAVLLVHSKLKKRVRTNANIAAQCRVII